MFYRLLSKIVKKYKCRPYSTNQVCPKFILNKRVFQKIEVLIIEVLLYIEMENPHTKLIFLSSVFPWWGCGVEEVKGK